MNGYSAKEKLAALLLTSSFVASPIANLGIVGSADEVPSTQVNSNTGGIETKDIPDVSVLESTINVSGDYSIKKADAGNIAYIGYGKKITLSASGSDWATLSKIELLDSDRNVCGEFSADSEDVDIQKSGTYSLKLYGVNGSTYEESLVDKVGFEKVSYDAVGVSISNVRLGYNGNALSDGSWVITSESVLGAERRFRVLNISLVSTYPIPGSEFLTKSELIPYPCFAANSRHFAGS